jgi:hypothetical protein
MKMPGADKAVVEIGKLRDYCLNPRHPRGRHKARMFAQKLGLSAEHASVLQTALLAAAAGNEASSGERDGYGQRFVVEFTMEGPAGTALVRSSWIVRTGEEFPRLTSCYVL